VTNPFALFQETLMSESPNEPSPPEDYETIALSDRGPVTIKTSDWPCIAEAGYDWHDGQVRSQANRIKRAGVRVLRHEDGRALVYATYSYSTNWSSEEGKAIKHGVLLDEQSGPHDINVCAAIRGVCMDMGNDTQEAQLFHQLANECQHDMPTEYI
jgi:hypothetical protein